MVSDTGGCIFYSDTNTVFVDSFSLTASLGPDDSLCAGNSIGLVSGGSQASSYLWSPGGDTTSSIQVDTTSIFVVTVSDTNGCIATDSVSIYVKGDAPDPDFAFSTTCLGDTMGFTDSSTVLTGTIISWAWDFGDGVGFSNLQNDTYRESSTNC